MLSKQQFLKRPLPLMQIIIAQQTVLLPLYFFNPLWIALLNIFGLLLLAIEQRNWFKSAQIKWLKISLALGALLAIYISYQNLSGKQAGTALICVMYGLKILETRSKRDANVLLNLGFFVLVTGFLITQKPWIMFYQLIPVVAIINALIAINSLQQKTRKNTSIKILLKDFSRYLLFALPVMILLFIFFPRLSGPIWRMPGSESAISGVSDSMSPGEISSLQLSDKVAFRVKFADPSFDAANLYWRVLTLDDFDGLSWRRKYSLPIKQNLKPEDNSEAISYSLTLEPTRQNYLVVAGVPIKTPAQSRLFDDYTLKTPYKISDRIRYDMRSVTNMDIPATLSAMQKQQYTQLPEKGNQQTRKWATNHRQLVNSDWKFILYILKKINQQNYFYSLNPPIMQKNIQDSFWLDHQIGFCEHYAGALVFIARAVGIPARVVVGYQGTEKNPLSDYWLVRNANAHAWTEIWIKDRGWLSVDPTAAIAPHRIEENVQQEYFFRDSLFDDFDFVSLENPGWFKRFDYWMDQFNHYWNDWVLDYNREKQIKNYKNWGIGFLTAGKIFIGVLLIIILITIIASLRIFTKKNNKDILQQAFLKLEKRLIKKGLIQADQARGPRQLKQQISQKGVIQMQSILQLIDEYIKLRYQIEKPHKQQLKMFFKKINNLVIPVNKK